MKQKLFYAIMIIILAFSVCLSISAQKKVLRLNQQTKFVLKNKEKQEMSLDLKKGDYTEIQWSDSLDQISDFRIISPSGKSVSEGIYFENPVPFVAKEDGEYKVIFEAGEVENNPTDEVFVEYTNVFNLPTSAKLKRQKKINGYDIKVYNTSENQKIGRGTYLLIEKAGKLIDILKGESLVGGGFNFADTPTADDSAANKKSEMLMRTTTDKTGDGTPDIAVQLYTGGAHCCFDMHFYELGKDGVRKLKTIQGQDSDIVALGKNANGSLILKTGDSNFAYWLTSFAGSPITTVILTYQNGEFRPDVKLMKKPAPSPAVLKQKAAKAKKEMDLNPYTGEENADFVSAFWGEMLDLMYSGNETSAWQYFDMVWDSRKPGKEKFKQDFLRKLNESEYWQIMQEGKK